MVQQHALIVLNTATATERETTSAVSVVRAIGCSPARFMLLLPELFRHVETDVGPRWEKKHQLWLDGCTRARAMVRNAVREAEGSSEPAEMLEAPITDRRKVIRACGQFNWIVYCDSIQQLTRRFRVTMLDEILKVGRPTILIPCGPDASGIHHVYENRAVK